MQHNDYQNKILPILRRGTKSSDEATIQEIVAKLLKIGEKMEAIELMFATNRSNSHFLQDSIGWTFFMSCLVADDNLIIEISENHQWSNDRTTKGFAMEVYPDEWLTILEPTATKALEAMR